MYLILISRSTNVELVISKLIETLEPKHNTYMYVDCMDKLLSTNEATQKPVCGTVHVMRLNASYQ